MAGSSKLRNETNKVKTVLTIIYLTNYWLFARYFPCHFISISCTCSEFLQYFKLWWQIFSFLQFSYQLCSRRFLLGQVKYFRVYLSAAFTNKSKIFYAITKLNKNLGYERSRKCFISILMLKILAHYFL